MSGSRSARRPRDIDREGRDRRNRSSDRQISSHNLRNYEPPQLDEGDRENDRRAKKIFFNAHKSAEWLKDVYHPSRETCKQLGKDMLEVAMSEGLDACFVEKLPAGKSDWKYKCKAPNCPKAFESLKFVLNHLKNKHPEILESVTTTASEDVYYQHYMKDPYAPFPQQKNDLRRLPPVVVPIQGAGRLGPFVAAPVEITWGVIANKRVKIPTGRKSRSPVRYDDLDAPTEDEVTVTDYRDINI